MPRHDDDTMSRERGRSDYGRDDERSMFGRHREDERGHDRERERMSGRDRDRERESMGRRDDEKRFGSDDHNRGIPMDETERLIASNKVEGTPVHDRHGDKLGTVHNFMVDKRKGNVVYAVLKHSGGFLGLNERYYPLEWNELTYDTRLGGYHTDLDDEDLKRFGSFDSDGRWHSRDRGEHMSRRRERSMRERW